MGRGYVAEFLPPNATLVGGGEPAASEGGQAAENGRAASAADTLPRNKDDDHKQLDAGALFVLKSRGSWLHCGYHLTTSIVSPSLLSLPFALTLLGWSAGVACLCIAGIVTFYAYNLLTLVLEHHAANGKRKLRFRDMADDILGPAWGRYLVGPIQFVICYGTYIYLLTTPNGRMELYQFIVIFGGVTMVMVQMPSFHSLRHINFFSLLLCLAYCACTTAGAIYIGYSKNAPTKDYTILESGTNRVFGFFNAFSIIATTYGNGMIPEIQATIAPPVTGKMFKGLLVCYAVVISTFFSVAISGYWAFGNQSQQSVLSNFLVGNRPLLPKPFILITYVFTLIQLSAVSLVYMQPTNVILERVFADPKEGEFSARNVVPRLISRSVSVVVATTLAAMLPFFGDMMALTGAFGFVPLDFVLPMVFYNLTFKHPSKKKSIAYWGNAVIAVTFIVLAILGIVASVRQIILDAKNYRLFANV